MSRDIRAVLRVAPDAGDAGGDDSGLAASER